VLYGEREDVNHIIFSCPLSRFIWTFMSEALAWDDFPRSMEELMGEWLPGKFRVDFQLCLTCFAGLAWAMWNNCNKMCINKCFPSAPMNLIHLGMSFLQRWCILMQKHTKTRVDRLLKLMAEQAQAFKPLDENPCDVGFI
jgi:hypothetical protein